MAAARKPRKRRRPGRPSLYSKRLAAALCKRLAAGKSLRDICDLATMPSRETVRRWLDSSAEFRGQYARARELYADEEADRILELVATKLPADSKLGSVEVQRRRLEVDAIQWRLARMAPKKYGDRLQLEGAPAGEPVRVEHTIDVEELDQVLEALADAGLVSLPEAEE